MALIRLMIFQSRGLRLALDLREVERVLPMPLLATAAGAPAFVGGFFDYQGRAVAAVRVDRLLAGAEDALGLYAPLILIARSQPTVALQVARIDGVVASDPAAIQPIGADQTFNGCVTGRLSDAHGTIYMLRAEALLLAAERARLAIFAAREQARLDAAAEASHAA